MSRTYRQPPHWANAQLIDILRDLPKDTSKSAIKWLNASMRRCRGQDGTCVTPAHEPCNSSLKGYGWWGSDGLNGKRFAKRRTARIMRRRGTKEARAQLHELWNDHQLDMEIELQEESDRAYEAWLLMDDDDDVPWYNEPYEDPFGLSCYDDAEDTEYWSRTHDREILKDMLKRRSANSIINLVHNIEVTRRLDQEMLNDYGLGEGQTLADILKSEMKRRGIPVEDTPLVLSDARDLRGFPNFP